MTHIFGALLGPTAASGCSTLLCDMVEVIGVIPTVIEGLDLRARFEVDAGTF